MARRWKVGDERERRKVSMAGMLGVRERWVEAEEHEERTAEMYAEVEGRGGDCAEVVDAIFDRCTWDGDGSE